MAAARRERAAGLRGVAHEDEPVTRPGKRSVGCMIYTVCAVVFSVIIALAVICVFAVSIILRS